MPKTLKLVLLSLRDLIVSIGPVVFVVIGLLIAATIIFPGVTPANLLALLGLG